jgi:hypothetical protein
MALISSDKGNKCKLVRVDRIKRMEHHRLLLGVSELSHVAMA